MDEHYLVVLQFFGFLVGVAVLVMRAAEFEQNVTWSGNQFHLCMIITSTVHGTSERQGPFASPQDSAFPLLFVLGKGIYWKMTTEMTPDGGKIYNYLLIVL